MCSDAWGRTGGKNPENRSKKNHTQDGARPDSPPRVWNNIPYPGTEYKYYIYLLRSMNEFIEHV
jgi:hypothetical protein